MVPFAIKVCRAQAHDDDDDVLCCLFSRPRSCGRERGKRYMGIRAGGGRARPGDRIGL